MAKTFFRNEITKSMMIALLGVVTILCGLLINSKNRFYIGAMIILVAFVLYFVSVYSIAKRNWLDVRAVFTGVWLSTLGLAALRLNDYQEQWKRNTWILLSLAYMVYQIGATIGIMNGERLFANLKKVSSKIQSKRISYEMQENRLFPICIIITLIGVVCFGINVAIKGYIPAFSSSTTAYVDFYTKFHLFAVASTAVSGLCYYCIKTQPLSMIKRVILWACIFYLVVLFPTLVISRGVFIVAALSLSTTIFYLNKQKLYVFVLCLIAMAGVYLFTSNLRGYSDEYLDTYFEPSDIEIETPDGEGGVQFSLPPKLSFLYGYFTVSHDNFNEAVQHLEGYTWGARQFYPFNVILNIQSISDMRADGEWYQVRPHLNTVNMIGVFYYDFHELGIVICTLLWALVFGLMQSFYMKSKGPFSLFILGYAMNPVALCFFASWVDTFELWMFWGTILIMGVMASLKVRPKKSCLE